MKKTAALVMIITMATGLVALAQERADSMATRKPLAVSAASAPRAVKVTGDPLDDVKTSILGAISNIAAYGDCQLRMKMDCPELSKTFETEMARRSPLPMEIKITQTYAVFRADKLDIQFELGLLPAEMRSFAEQKLNALTRQQPYDDVLNKVTGNILITAGKLMIDQNSIDVIAQTPDLLDVEVNEMDEPFVVGTRIKSIRMRIDPKEQTFRSVDMMLDNRCYVRLKASFTTLAQVPGKNRKIHLPLEWKVDQNIGMLNLPEQFTWKFSDPQFAQPQAGGEGR